MKCVKCGQEHAQYHFRVLQVQTLHVRDFGKNSRIQALGDFEEYSVCAACAEEKYDRYVHLSPTAQINTPIYGMVMLIGLVLTAIFWNGDGGLRLGVSAGGRSQKAGCQ